MERIGLGLEKQGVRGAEPRLEALVSSMKLTVGVFSLKFIEQSNGTYFPCSLCKQTHLV